MDNLFIEGFIAFFTVSSFVYLNLGLLLGLVFGSIPGLTVMLCLVLFMPFTYTMDAIASFMFLLGIYCSGSYGGSISAILINNSKFYENYRCKNIRVKNEYYDYIVLGSGPSGSINSYYLNEKFPGKVLLLEKGKDVSKFKSKHPQDEFIKKWKNGGFNSTLFPLQIPFASGECFGGGSEINSGLFHKPSKKFLYNWSTKLNFVKPNEDEIDNHFNEIEKILENSQIIPESNSHKFFIRGIKVSNQI